eukprot:2877650-Pleurochrysis_carterae.AAC.3
MASLCGTSSFEQRTGNQRECSEPAQRKRSTRRTQSEQLRCRTSAKRVQQQPESWCLTESGAVKKKHTDSCHVRKLLRCSSQIIVKPSPHVGPSTKRVYATNLQKGRARRPGRQGHQLRRRSP